MSPRGWNAEAHQKTGKEGAGYFQSYGIAGQIGVEMGSITTDIRFSIVPEQVLDADISDRAVRIYALLARYADNDTGKCFPSRETLAKRAKCHVRSVGRAIDELIEIGAVEKNHRKDGNGFTSNLYVVKKVVTGAPGGRAPTPEGRAQAPEGSDTGVPLTRTTELEPINENHLTKQFEQFWSIYPSKKDKRAASKAFASALKRADFETILSGVASYRDDPNRDPGFTKNPATWLNADAWENDPEQPRNRGFVKPTAAERTAQLIHGARAKDEQDLITKGIGAGPDFGHMLKGVDS